MNLDVQEVYMSENLSGRLFRKRPIFPIPENTFKRGAAGWLVGNIPVYEEHYRYRRSEKRWQDP